MHRSKHSHTDNHAAPITQGRTIHWAHLYDLVVKLLTFGREATLRNKTIRQATISTGAAVLDVGCGTGTLTLLAKAEAGDQGTVYGIDASPEMIAVARQKAAQQQCEVDFQLAAIEELPFSDGTFDVVLSSLMFHHLPSDLQQRALIEIYRVLKPGGRLIIVDMKSPTRLAQRLALTALVHHGSTNDVHDLLPRMEAIGYASCQAGDMSWSVIAFVQGNRAK